MQISPRRRTGHGEEVPPFGVGRGIDSHVAPIAAPLVARPELLAWLNADAAKLITVVAGAGWGKSTLIELWQADPARTLPLAVMSADIGDTDPVVFLARIVSCLASAAPNRAWEHPARLLNRQEPDIAGAVLPALWHALAEAGPIGLAVDDLHRVTGADSHAALAALIGRLPEGCRVLLASRTPPQVPLGRLRAAGRLVELGPRQLRLTLPQTAELIAAVAGAAAADDIVAGIHQLTEGWAAAVFLAARLLRDQSVPHLVLTRLSAAHGHVAELFAEEVLSSVLSPEQARTLTRSAILDRFSPALIRAVTGGELPLADPRAVGNLFLIPLDPHGSWFRHHQLLQAVLYGRLQQTEPEAIPDLHRRAAAWLVHDGQLPEAISHALHAGDTAGAAELIGAAYPPFLATGRRGTVVSWLRQLGDAAITAHAPAAIAAAWTAALGGERAAVSHHLAAAERAGRSGPLPDGTRSVASAVALVRAMFGFDGFTAMAEAAQTAVALETDATSPWHAMACLTLGHVRYLSGDPCAAVAHLDAGFAAQAAMPMIRIAACALLALCHHELGHPEQAERLATAAEQLVQDHALERSPQAALVLTAHAAIAAGRAEFVRARELLTTAHTWRQTVPGISPWPDLHILALHAQVCLADGDRRGAHRLIHDAQALISRLPDPHGPPIERLEKLRRQTRAQARRPTPSQTLTAAEVTLLQLLPTKLTLVEIARRRGVSINTVKTQAAAVYRKLDADGRDQAVEIARRNGLIP